MRNEHGRGRGASLGQILSRRPEAVWPDGVVHHGTRVLLLLLVAVSITALFPPVDRRAVARWELGMVVDQDIIAEVPFAVPKGAEELRREREAVAASVPPTFDYRAEAADSMAAELERFFSSADSAAEAGAAAVEAFLSRRGLPAQPEQVDLLTDGGSRELVRTAALRAAREIVADGVHDGSDAPTTDRVAVRVAGQDQGYIGAEELLGFSEFLEEAEDLLGLAPSAELSGLLRLILIRHLDFTYSLNVAATELDRNQAGQAVPTTRETILAGEAIVRANQQIRPAELERLNAYEEQRRTLGIAEEEAGTNPLPLIGSTLLYALVLGIYALVVFFFRNEIYTNFRWILLHALLALGFFVAAAPIAARQWPTELLPIAFVALLVGVLWDGRVALVMVMTLAVVSGVLPPFGDYSVVLVTLVGGAAAALSVRAVRRRAQVLIIIAIISAADAAVILAYGLVTREAAAEIVVSGASAALAAAVSAVVMLFLPLFEWFTGITTDQTLLEWADPNRPLLRRLSLEAPGTHAHTTQVANMSEAAASAIGANGLLCRVGSYYHDIGKILKPQYFVENQPGGRNPHDKLKPETSAAIVREHVVEGLRLARENKVPAKIAAFIPEHHGTQRIEYFYQKAVADNGDEDLDEDLDPIPYTYPGPKPQSRETAITMLADSVESACKVLQDPTPERIQELVHSLVESKVQDGQLDEADLTLKEIASVEQQFVKMLSGVYHHRIDYPTTKHLTEVPEGGEVAAALGEPGPESEREEGAPAEARTPEGDSATADAAGTPASGTGPDQGSSETRDLFSSG